MNLFFVLEIVCFIFLVTYGARALIGAIKGIDNMKVNLLILKMNIALALTCLCAALSSITK